MSHEHTTGAEFDCSTPFDGFGFTEDEQLFYRVSHERFTEILEDEVTIIHRVDESTNNYGEFLFVTVSRPNGERRELVTFYGYGYHEPRERWLVDQWFWYRANPFPETLERQVSKDEASTLLNQRRIWIAPFVAEEPQSARGRLFEWLADLTDDDAATVELAELEDLGGDAVLQFEMFSGTLVDNRTLNQRRQDAEREQPQQAEMFSQRDLAQFGAGVKPMPLPQAARLRLESQDHRTPEEVEADVQREAEERTAMMFGNQLESGEKPLVKLDEIMRGLHERLQYLGLGLVDRHEDE